MTGPVAAALALATALLIPVSPRPRLDPARTRARARRWPLTVGALAAAGIGAIALPAPVGLAATVLAGTAALRYRRRARRRRGLDEGRALESALEVLVGELNVGAHPVRAFQVAAAEAGEPTVAAALRTVAARARLGADVAGGLRGVAARSTLPVHWERLAVYWQLAGEHGLAISALMRAAQRDIAERQRYCARVQAGMAGARASAGILAALPVLGVLLGQLIGARPVAFLLAPAGAPLLIAGVTLACLGLLWSDRISGPAT